MFELICLKAFSPRYLLGLFQARTCLALVVEQGSIEDLRPCHTMQHFLQLVSQQCCETSCRKNCIVLHPLFATRNATKCCVASCRKSRTVFYFSQRCETSCNVWHGHCNLCRNAVSVARQVAGNVASCGLAFKEGFLEEFSCFTSSLRPKELHCGKENYKSKIGIVILWATRNMIRVETLSQKVRSPNLSKSGNV